MPSRLDLTGNVYGELTVVEMLYNYNNTHRTYCRCLAINGVEVIVRADALQSGATCSIKGAGRTGKSMDIKCPSIFSYKTINYVLFRNPL